MEVQDEDFLTEMYRDLARLEKEMHDYNDALLEQHGIPKEDFKELCDDCNITGNLEIVDKPKGTNNNETCGIFKEVWVLQYTSGEGGDCYHGFMYGKFGKDKWLKIPYEC